MTAPYLYDRYLTLSALLSNGPGRIQSVNNFQDYEIKFKDRLRNCEDVLVDENIGIAFLSCDPGRDRWNTVMVGSIAYYMAALQPCIFHFLRA